MAKSPRAAHKTSRKVPNRQFIEDPDELLKAILKAVGSLAPGEGLEIRRVRASKTGLMKSAKKKVARRAPRRKPRP